MHLALLNVVTATIATLTNGKKRTNSDKQTHFQAIVTRLLEHTKDTKKQKRSQKKK